jgi:hypothetical protein
LSFRHHTPKPSTVYIIKIHDPEYYHFFLLCIIRRRREEEEGEDRSACRTNTPPPKAELVGKAITRNHIDATPSLLYTRLVPPYSS